MTDGEAAERRPQGWKAWAGLAVVCATVLMWGADQQLRSLLAEPIRLALGLSDAQLGHLNGFAVAIVAALAAPLFGWAADRTDRRWVLMASVLLWSAATAAAGLAQSFTGLMWSAVAMALGEAALIPIAYAIVTNWFAPSERARANAVLYAVLLLGGGFTMAASGSLYGWLGQAHPGLPLAAGAEPWRLMFFLGAAAGVPIILLLLLAPRAKPVAGAGLAAPAMTANHGAVLRHFRLHGWTIVRVYVGTMLYAGAWMMLIMWAPLVMVRSLGVEVARTGELIGLLNVAASASGVVVGYFVHRRWLTASGSAGNLRLATWGALTATLPMALMLIDGGLLWFSAMLFLASAALVVATSQAPSILQCMAPDAIRSQVIASYSLVVLPLRGAFPVAVGSLSDSLVGWADRPLLVALVVVSVAGMLLGALLMHSTENDFGALGDGVLREERAAHEASGH